MKVLALTRYPRLGSTSRVRFLAYAPWLEAADLDVTWAPLWKESYLRRFYDGKRARLSMVASRYARRLLSLLAARRYDVVWLETEALPFLPPLAELALARARIPYVVDFDDAVFHKYDSHRSPLVRAALSRKVDTVMRGAAVVVAGNDYIAARARAAGARRVEVVPTVVDLERFPKAPAPPSQPPRVVWIGTSETARYLRLVEEPLRELCREGAVTVRLIGAGSPKLSFPFEERPWSEATEVDALSDCDIGIMPLFDSPFERGKCGYKLIQYMACGLAAVGSPVGVNADIIDDGRNGRLASTTADWRAALLELAGDPSLRLELGARARLTVEERFSLQRTGPRLAGLLRGVASGDLSEA